MIIKDYIASLSDNPYFGAGFGLVGVGTALAVLRKGLQLGGIVFRRRLMMSIEVSSKDKCYIWLLQWIAKNASKSTQHLSVETSFHQSETGKISTKIDYVPSPGDHFITYGGRLVKVERNRESQMVGSASGPFESVKLITFGTDKRFFADIVEDARQLAVHQLQGYTMLFQSFGSEWRPFGYPRRKRPLESVLLDVGVKERIVGDLSEFLNSSQWYIDRGIPFRRGYLMHGPPGGGKSSFILALAGAFDCCICTLSLSERSLTDDRLQHLLNSAPLNAIILLEDVDAAFVSREDSPEVQSRYEGLSRVTFSGLLNALDGVTSSEARVLFMTTNYPDRLDSALIRPGRVDVKQYIGYCSDYQLAALFKRFYPDAKDDEVNEFVKQLNLLNKQVTPAQVQGYLLLYKDRSEQALANIEQFLNVTK